MLWDDKMSLSAWAALAGVSVRPGQSESENGFFWFLLGILIGILSFLSTPLLCLP